MPILRVATTLLLTVGLAGCATRPVPDNIPGVDTFTIVKKIRCETYFSLRDSLIGFLATNDRKAIAAKLMRNEMRVDDLNAGNVGPELMTVIDRYKGTTVGYAFTFDITESNNTSANANFQLPLVKGPFALGAQAQADQQRQNTRGFRLIESWEDLLIEERKKNEKVRLQKDNAETCEKYKDETRDIIYPINGKIGMLNQIKLFYNLNETGALVGTGTDAVPTLTDTVSFTTTVRGSVTPSITIGVVGRDFQLASASATAEAKRVDLNRVIVTLALPPKKTAPSGPPTATAKESARIQTSIELDRREDLESLTINPSAIERILRTSRPN